jgi:hypothetical protein
VCAVFTAEIAFSFIYMQQHQQPRLRVYYILTHASTAHEHGAAAAAKAETDEGAAAGPLCFDSNQTAVL